MLNPGGLWGGAWRRKSTKHGWQKKIGVDRCRWGDGLGDTILNEWLLEIYFGGLWFRSLRDFWSILSCTT